MILFDVSSLIKAPPGSALTLDLDTDARALDDLQVEFLKGTLQVIRVQTGLMVSGEVATEIEMECVRCLDSFNLPITVEFEETFRLAGTSQSAEQPYEVMPDGRIDLAPLLREIIWVALPMKPLCRTECKGFCAQCGANLNVETCTCEETIIDPRWAALKDLL
jgi:uncharacterized protein